MLALCSDGNCREMCDLDSVHSIHFNHARILQGILPTQTTCKNGSFVCPGGECMPNLFNCPTVETCDGSYFRCPDGSCVEDTIHC
jgi:hypothetical protein